MTDLHRYGTHHADIGSHLEAYVDLVGVHPCVTHLEAHVDLVGVHPCVLGLRLVQRELPVDLTQKVLVPLPAHVRRWDGSGTNG